jgi:hypothetical protein
MFQDKAQTAENGWQSVELGIIYCGKTEFGQISRSLSLNSGAIRLKRPENLTQIGFPSLRSAKFDRLLSFSRAAPRRCTSWQGPGHYLRGAPCGQPLPNSLNPQLSR